MLAFLLDEELAARGDGAVLLSSASSKTAAAIAFLLAARGCAVIGLTSPRNEPFVRDLGVYDTAVGYDAIDALLRRPIAFTRYAAWTEGWLTVRRAAGPEAARAAWLDVLGGRVAPNAAHVVSMQPSV